MQVKCPFAEWRPLGSQTEPAIDTSKHIPTVLIFHTMVGYLRGTDSMFKQNGYGGTESHFGVGGNYDSGLDGAIWQWQTLDHTADAQYTGNAYATSVETSDGAHSNVPWSNKQLNSLVKLGTWWCRETGNPARLVKSPTEKGFGYHQQFITWNRDNHACPGSARIKQLVNIVIPRVKAELSGGLVVATKADVEAIWLTDGVVKSPPWKQDDGNMFWPPSEYLYWSYVNQAKLDDKVEAVQKELDELKATLADIKAAVVK